MNEISIESDIVIIGGGIAGCIAAISLINHYKVILIDKDAIPKPRIGECLAPPARRILKQLQLEDALEQSNSHLINYGIQSYWGSDRPRIVDNLRNPDGNGWYLDRREFESFLRKSAKNRGVHCIWPAQYHSAKQEGSQWKIIAKSDMKILDPIVYTITSKFVIDATGRQSHFARQQNVKRTTFDKLVSCWATIPNYNTNKMSLIVSDPQGWWYTSPLPKNKLLVSFQSDSDLTDRRMHKNKSLFLTHALGNPVLQKTINGHENELELRGIVSANSTRLDYASVNQWAALGDAALSFDPLSSQGMFNAMANAMQFSELMILHKVIEKHKNSTPKKFYTEYNYQINAVWQQYQSHKKLYYSQESRWKDAIFWKRRIQ